MSDADALRSFVLDVLSDVGAETSEKDGVLWARLPASLGPDLGLPAAFGAAFDPGRAGASGAEIVAPGSYLLERVLAVAMRRGRWDAARVEPPPGDWPRDALLRARVPPDAVPSRPESIRDEWFFLFTFRTTLVSDEKQEGFHAVAVPEDADGAWEVSPEIAGLPLTPCPWPSDVRGLEGLYGLAAGALAQASRQRLDAFRKASLARLEEEVRRILRYFDRTVLEIREAGPVGVEDLVRAIERERDRRLAEALERHDAKASASLCGVRAVLAPVAEWRVALEPNVPEARLRVDAWTGRVRGLRGASTEAESAPLPAGPPSGTPPRRRTGGRGSRRSPPGPRARSRSGAGRGSGP